MIFINLLLMKFLKASHLGLYCLLMSHNKDDKLTKVKEIRSMPRIHLSNIMSDQNC